jgi:hypothetical protein
VIVESHNFVLPEWGGIDGGEVDVRLEDGAVEATLARTGDDVYEMVRFDRETFFKRSTCSYFQRVPGGGARVLEPFLLMGTALLDTTVVSVAADDEGAILITGEFPNIGQAILEVDASTYLPKTLIRPRDESGNEASWTFAVWNQPPGLREPPDYEGDQGPGGDPC